MKTVDVVGEGGLLFLGSRLKRLGERMQGEVQRVIEAAGLPIQPAHYPLLTVLDEAGPLTVGEVSQAIGLSQPLTTRTLSRLEELGLVCASRGDDLRHKRVSLTADGAALMARSRQDVWPRVEQAVRELAGQAEGSLLDQLAKIEQRMATEAIDRRAARLSILGWSPEHAGAFHTINAEWIDGMFRMEATDREVLENPVERIVAPGGDILFVALAGHGIVGTCALQKTGERQFELTKMGVRAEARGSGAGAVVLAATIARARELGAECLYLLTNRRCASAIRLYERAGFEHDADIMERFGRRYDRCDVAMRYRGR